MQQTLQFRHRVRIEVAIQPDATKPVPWDGRTPRAAVEDHLKRHEIPAQETADRSVSRGIVQVLVATYQVLLEQPVDRPQVVAVVRPHLRVARHPRGIETAGVRRIPNIRVARLQEIQRFLVVDGFAVVTGAHLVEDLRSGDGVCPMGAGATCLATTMA
jgi:hypothetical protein